MPEFNYLKDRGNFPHIDNVNVYKNIVQNIQKNGGKFYIQMQKCKITSKKLRYFKMDVKKIKEKL